MNKPRKFSQASLSSFLMLLVGLFVLSGTLRASDSPVFTKVIEDGEYKEVLEAVKDVIKGKGINIAHTLPPSEMLERTGPAFGIDKPVLKNGEIVEFCSAKISHQLIMANPENITLCPFTLSVYELASAPNQIRITYRKPHVIDDASKEAIEQMVKLLDDIIAEAADW